jgi:hypothetical protein
MLTNRWLSLVGFLAVSLVGAVGCSSPPPANRPANPAAEAMARVMNEDVRVQRSWDALARQGRISVVDYYRTLALTAMRRDLAGCPPEFQAAYRKNVEATQQMLRVAMTYEGQIGSFQHLLNLYALEGTPATTPVERAVQDAGRAMDDTWRQCEAVAARYGVTRANHPAAR